MMWDTFVNKRAAHFLPRNYAVHKSVLETNGIHVFKKRFG